MQFVKRSKSPYGIGLAIALGSCFMIFSPALAVEDGAEIFKSKCAMCHPDGGNRANPEKSVKGSKYLQARDTFKQLLSKKNGLMPPFKALADDDEALTTLYGYCKKLK